MSKYLLFVLSYCQLPAILGGPVWILLWTVFACRSDKTESVVEEPEWWESDVEETDESDGSSSSDSEDDKPEDGEFEDEKDSGLGDTQDCGDDFDPTASCSGDWTTTLCMHDGLYWWCEGGVWINEEDKS